MSIAISLGGRFGVRCEPVHTLVNFLPKRVLLAATLVIETSRVDRDRTSPLMAWSPLASAHTLGVIAGPGGGRAKASGMLGTKYPEYADFPMPTPRISAVSG
jgi:hypothetical protein